MNSTVENIAKRAQNIIISQIESYRAIQGKAGIILGSIAIFIPLFTIIPSSNIYWLEIVKLISFLMSGISSFLMIIILIHRKIRDGYSQEVFNEIANYKEEEYYNFEIGMALTNIESNDKSLNRMNKVYNYGLFSFLIALVIIITTYSINQFNIMNKKKEVTKKEQKKESVTKIKFEKVDQSKSRFIVGLERPKEKKDNKD